MRLYAQVQYSTVQYSTIVGFSPFFPYLFSLPYGNVTRVIKTPYRYRYRTVRYRTVPHIWVDILCWYVRTNRIPVFDVTRYRTQGRAARMYGMYLNRRVAVTYGTVRYRTVTMFDYITIRYGTCTVP